MRLLKLVGVLSLVTVLSTGCYKSENGENNPINLFDELPIYNEEKREISDKVKVIAGSADLTHILNLEIKSNMLISMT